MPQPYVTEPDYEIGSPDGPINVPALPASNLGPYSICTRTESSPHESIKLFLYLTI